MGKSLQHQLTNIYVFFEAAKNRFLFSGASNKKVLVVIDGLIGDTVLIQDFLNECRAYFTSKGYSIDLFFSKKFVSSFFEECCDIKGFHIIDAHYKKKEVDLKDLRQVQKAFRGREYEYILNPLPKLKGDKITACIHGKYKLAVRDDHVMSGQPLNNLFRKITYTTTAVVPKSVMEFQRYQKLLELCGDDKYKTRLPVLPERKTESIVQFDSYCVFSVGASEAGKCWERERFAHAVDHILDRYGIPVVFVGAAADKEIVDDIRSRIKDDSLTLDVTGKTGFAEWVNIIRNARFLVGNDSASVHIAVGTGTPSLCIVGEWQYKRFYPYVTDIPGDVIRAVVNCGTELSCKDCGRNIRLMKNENCRKRLRGGLTLECIDRIKEEQVIRVIDDMVEKQTGMEKTEF